MANINDLIQLFSAISEENSATAKAVALDIANKEGKKGRRNSEQLLKSALLTSRPSEVVQALGHSILEKALVSSGSPLDLEDIFLSNGIRDELFSIIEEFVSRWELKKHGILNRNKILLVGPPGCGKSVTAKALGKKLRLPVFILSFDSLIGSYLGQTAQNLKEVFNFIHETPCIVLIDEIDAISSERGGLRDIAEVDRIVISLMQQLDLVSPAGILVCTSNLPRSIDPAVLRRFDCILEFPKPSLKELVAYGNSLAKKHGLKTLGKLSVELKRYRSFAEVERYVLTLSRKQILENLRKGQG